jgi:hypothetical protein
LKIEVTNTIGYQKSRSVRACTVALLFIIFSFQLHAQTSREYIIKAGFLYNFTQFVDWPSNAFQNAEAPFVIAILGDDPFRAALDTAVAGEKVKGHSIVIERYQNVKDIKNCHILFINHKESTRLKEILPALPSKHILTVSDIPDFATTGGMIRFITKKNKIKLQINLKASKEAELIFSSKLLQVADIVR